MRDFRTGLRPQTWIAVLLAAGIVSSSTPASAKVVCVTKKGGLVLRDGCKPNEVRLDADEAGLRGPKGDPGPPGPAAPPEQKPGPAKPSRGGGLEVLDAAGKDVGVVDSIGFYGGGARVVRDIGTDFFVFSVDKSGFQASDFGNFMFYYASPDCSGSRYL